LFDGAAQLYQDSRPGYPDEIVDLTVATAGLAAGSTVLEVGCGTGQLTERLAGFGFHLTAIDIGPSMVATARDRLADAAVSFRVISFEDFAAPDGSFDLIVSATAFHWIDPEIKFRKSAWLLRPGGWLAVLATDQSYDGPLGTALAGMWAARGGEWPWQPTPADAVSMAGTGLFETPVHRTHVQPIVRPVADVIGLENTRATSLSWPDDVRREFTEELGRHLGSRTEVLLRQQTSLSMARVLPSPPPGDHDARR
jgi:SAM-dependent methyltransferase